jgi:excisionase family DNA binding protein
MSTKPLTRFYTVAQVANLLAVSQRSVRRWIAARELLAHKFGRQLRIAESDLRAFVEWRRTAQA